MPSPFFDSARLARLSGATPGVTQPKVAFPFLKQTHAMTEDPVPTLPDYAGATPALPASVKEAHVIGIANAAGHRFVVQDARDLATIDAVWQDAKQGGRHVVAVTVKVWSGTQMVPRTQNGALVPCAAHPTGCP
jgi:hypothetical protein